MPDELVPSDFRGAIFKKRSNGTRKKSDIILEVEDYFSKVRFAMTSMELSLGGGGNFPDEAIFNIFVLCI